MTKALPWIIGFTFLYVVFLPKIVKEAHNTDRTQGTENTTFLELINR